VGSLEIDLIGLAICFLLLFVVGFIVGISIGFLMWGSTVSERIEYD